MSQAANVTSTAVALHAYPDDVPNWIAGQAAAAAAGEWFDKYDPAVGTVLGREARSRAADVDRAVAAARAGQPAWAALTPVHRGEILHDVAVALRSARAEVARVVARETGKSYANALGETDGA